MRYILKDSSTERRVFCQIFLRFSVDSSERLGSWDGIPSGRSSTVTIPKNSLQFSRIPQLIFEVLLSLMGLASQASPKEISDDPLLRFSGISNIFRILYLPDTQVILYFVAVSE